MCLEGKVMFKVDEDTLELLFDKSLTPELEPRSAWMSQQLSKMCKNVTTVCWEICVDAG